MQLDLVLNPKCFVPALFFSLLSHSMTSVVPVAHLPNALNCSDQIATYESSSVSHSHRLNSFNLRISFECNYLYSPCSKKVLFWRDCEINNAVGFKKMLKHKLVRSCSCSFGDADFG